MYGINNVNFPWLTTHPLPQAPVDNNMLSSQYQPCYKSQAPTILTQTVILFRTQLAMI